MRVVSVSAPPVLVLGSGLTALGVIRVLGRAGVRAYVLTGARDWIRRSRWFRAAPEAPDAPADAGAGAGVGADLSRYLESVPVPKAVLVPCSDDWARQAASLDPELAARFPTSVSPVPVIETMVDKARFADTLRTLDVPHPRTFELESASDLDGLPDGAFDDAFLKPRDSQRFFRRYGVKAFRIQDPADAARRLAELESAGLAVVLQQYIPGPASNHYFIDGFADRDGRIQALLARRRWRIYPPDFGNSTYITSVPLAETAGAVDTIRRLVAELGFRGVFSAEFKRDERDGLFKILELNARPWWYVEFAARCGVDVCTMAYRDALGLPVEPVADYAVGKSCIYRYYDFFTCRALQRQGRLSLASWASSWLTSHQPIFTWDDPLPAFGEWAAILGRFARRGLRLRSDALNA